MKAFVSAQMTQDGLDRLSSYVDEIKFGGWGATGKKLTPEELVKEAADCEILVICYEEINDYVLDHLPSLKFIACSRSGIENVDKDAVRRHNVPVSFSPGRNANAVAELAVGLMICAMRHIPKTFYYIKSEQWDRVPWDIAGNTSFKTFDGFELYGKTIGFVGYGAIARRVTKLLSGFDVNVIAYDPFIKTWPTDGSVKDVNMIELFSTADIISLHCKLTEDTQGMVNADALKLMKPTSVLINTARGALVDEEALYQALSSKQIACAALDVQINEPMAHDSKFLELDNMILTPHIGGASKDIIAQQTRILLEDIDSFFQRGRPIHAVQ
ncbi:MAG: NAD(P)-dependent oxidoreductase [Oscillibacter sp.]|nr:NAD(P)-dependent oxidoreductase [Oscillibacter sp.]MEA4994197.1 NAD(P)-dependent oxidoreductase [Oscillibacter sp.]